MVVALVSLLTGRPVRAGIAMTGEVTLSGRVLPVGGIKEKVLAARRQGLSDVVLPQQNDKNVKEDLSEELRRDVRVHLVSTIDEVVRAALDLPPSPAPIAGAPPPATPVQEPVV
jgi:ATP-dependent Lon protease